MSPWTTCQLIKQTDVTLPAMIMMMIHSNETNTSYMLFSIIQWNHTLVCDVSVLLRCFHIQHLLDSYQEILINFFEFWKWFRSGFYCWKPTHKLHRLLRQPTNWTKQFSKKNSNNTVYCILYCNIYDKWEMYLYLKEK